MSMVQYTKAAIVDEFKRQALQGAVNSISVRSLTQTLNMNVKTFYYHFHSMPDMISWFTENELKAAVGENYHIDDWHAGLVSVVQYAQDNAALIKAISASKYWPEVRMLYIKLYKKHVERMVESFLPLIGSEDKKIPVSDEVREITADYYSLLFYVLLEKWVFSGMRSEPETYINLCTRILGRGAILDAMRRLSEYESETL